ncbi:5-methylcytosine-specific restriction protein A [Cryobacterium mesophilum]|uniref:HNH endonuclease n=1 Tax=Terrimesophilobacter mesophilus TaxID=433647 RepID=A0A4R8VDG3_9MICO|nr:HNH endonuclease signature motif containing protein [Terrimesophilobacter mesophilus]MBB5634047.1 5-methylcytosine-specific restriction protein A [Terrimesophilobacter mesophilus]TFB81394.1 HNH endonuclease [Terrimesophilobacter mesophilus]
MASPTATLDSSATCAVDPVVPDAPIADALGSDALASDALRSMALRLAAALPARAVQGLRDDELLNVTGAVEHLGRYVDALRVEAAAEISARSLVVCRAEGLAARKGCRNAAELIERVTRVSGATAARRIKLGQFTRTDLAEPGVARAPRFPSIADALEAGLIGVDAASAIVVGIQPTLRRGGVEEVRAAEEELVAAAIGTSDLVPTACTADEIRQQAMVWQAYLDPDGMEPVERRAWNARGFEAGTLSGGLVRGRFALMPEIAAKLNRLFDAYLSPRVTTEFRTAEEQAEVDAEADPRSRDQQRHDVVAAMVDHYSRSDEPPTIGGAAPTVLVTVRDADLEAGHGRGHIDGAKSDVSMTTIRHLACSGGYQLVSIDAYGSIHGLGSPQRCFTPAQRRAIIARDGGCVIPGCTIPAAWCEIHHVDPVENNGPTHTDNGVLLCWSHHRTIETSGWQIRMIGGAPHVKPPPWISHGAPWRPATKSPTMLADAIEKRMLRC